MMSTAGEKYSAIVSVVMPPLASMMMCAHRALSSAATCLIDMNQHHAPLESINTNAHRALVLPPPRRSD